MMLSPPRKARPFGARASASARRVACLSLLAVAATACGRQPSLEGAPVVDRFEEGGASGNGGTGGGPSLGGGGAGGSGGRRYECDEACPLGQVCSHGVCVTQTDCSKEDDCQNDSHCAPEGCVPWGEGQGDPGCQVGQPPGHFAPTIKCEFATPPVGDAFPAHRDVQATPIVVNFNARTGGVPSIVVPFTETVVGGYTENRGVVRVLRGDTCALEANLGGGAAGYASFLASSAPVAVGDLDGDGEADIVSTSSQGTLVAFTRKAGLWAVLWESPPLAQTCVVGGGCTWAGPSIHDLDDDGFPEIVHEATVLDGVTGALMAEAPADYASYRQGLNPVVANLDDDLNAELTNGQGVWQWDLAAAGWVREPGFATGYPGFAAVADFGAYGAGLPPTRPEIVRVGENEVTIFALDGTLVLGPVPVPARVGDATPGGGAPTVADYDGDGLPEVGVAAEAFLTVYDIDCAGVPRPSGTCNAGSHCEDENGVAGLCPAGVLWSRRTQDISSNITGSSVFDFEADGKAEVVYADECFVRVYDGTDGAVLFSQYRSSCTWYENPVVADTDGNFHADLVTPSNRACAPDVETGISCGLPYDAAARVDAQFPGVRCKEAGDCVSGSCDAGYCRCVATAGCCGAGTDAACEEQGYLCAAPPAGTLGAGNTCRATHPHGVSGIRVYSDSQERWVRSRTIWSQHAYHVTHVNEDGTVPRLSAWAKNWEQPELNNFRQNVPGTANGQATPDLTAGASGFSCDGSGVSLRAPVCNRGAESMAAGVVVGFYAVGARVCDAVTRGPLKPGECEDVTCAWSTPPANSGLAVDVDVLVDDGAQTVECWEENNHGTLRGVYCTPPA